MSIATVQLTLHLGCRMERLTHRSKAGWSLGVSRLINRRVKRRSLSLFEIASLSRVSYCCPFGGFTCRSTFSYIPMGVLMLWEGKPKSTGGNNVRRLDIQFRVTAAPLSAVCVEDILRESIGCRWRQ